MSYSTSTNVSMAANEIFGTIKERAQLAAVYFTDFEKSVVKATNRDLVPPKQKHVAILISATHDHGFNVTALFREIDKRLSEGSWIVAFKALILIHYLMKEGHEEKVMSYLGAHPGILNMSSFRDASSGGQGLDQSKNIKIYATYLEERVALSRQLKTDFLRSKSEPERLRSMPWGDDMHDELTGLLRLVKTLTECKFFLDTLNNDITLEAMRMIVLDLFKVYQALTEGVSSMLKMFFDLKRPQALRALDLYKKFLEQTTKTSEFFDGLRRVQQGIGVNVPELKIPPASLARTLQDYVDSPDFEREQQARQRASSRQTQLPNSGLIDVFASGSSSSNSLPRLTHPVQNQNQFQQQNQIVQNQMQLSRQQSQTGEQLDAFGFAQPVSPQQQQMQIAPRQASQSSMGNPVSNFDFPANNNMLAQPQMQMGAVSQPTFPTQNRSMQFQQQSSQQSMALFAGNAQPIVQQPSFGNQTSFNQNVGNSNYQYRPSMQQSMSMPAMPLGQQQMLQPSFGNQPQFQQPKMPQQPMFGGPSQTMQNPNMFQQQPMGMRPPMSGGFMPQQQQIRPQRPQMSNGNDNSLL